LPFVYVERRAMNIHKHCARLQSSDGTRCGPEGEWRGNDLASTGSIQWPSAIARRTRAHPTANFAPTYSALRALALRLGTEDKVLRFKYYE
jgi:hypothetical protein